jgi:hypothetical protein
MLVNIFFCSETQVRSETNSLSTLPWNSHVSF